MSQKLNDLDPAETQEWLDALQNVVDEEGPERAQFIINSLLEGLGAAGTGLGQITSAYLNTIRTEDQPEYPGDQAIEARIIDYLRWNAMATVVRGGKRSSQLGGHIASFASSVALYEVAYNHFFHAPTEQHGGDLIYYQGHITPGIYARALLEGRLSTEQLDHFREEVEVDGLASYPHPWLMPDFWQFPTVSMGLGPIQAIYQARFLKYLHNRNLVDTAPRKVWAFCGDGEMDEPESLGALSIAAREKLDNLIFVVNCNLQRLDGPVRGNSKIIQELEGIFRGAGWEVIKVIWDSNWDELLAQDSQGSLKRFLETTIDGEYQNFKAKDATYAREKFFAKDPEVAAMFANLTDEQIENLNYGGHDLEKVYAAYHRAMHIEGKPVVILPKTVKGFGMGTVGQGQNTTHQQKKLSTDDIKGMRDRFSIPVKDTEIESVPFALLDQSSEEYKYLQQRRENLGGYLPQRRQESESLPVPELAAFDSHLHATGDREISTTMAFVRILSTLLKDKTLKQRIVPIVPDESRTFGMEGMFRQLGIYSPSGQLYEPVDAGQLMYYREEVSGQILEEGINEAGGFCSWLAAATSYSTNNYPMIPFYIYYSMFGFQRVGDLAWLAGDMRARGFLLGGTAGRTTLAGEGLQHQDGHSLIMSGLIPNCVSYDPTFSYELAVIIQDGLRRMVTEQEDVYYYITLMNENYSHPEMPEGVAEGIIKGMYQFSTGAKAKHKVQLLGSGTILREVIKAAEILAKDYDVSADVWSVPSFTELAREANAVERENRLHPDQPAKLSYVEECFQDLQGPVIAATDYIRSYADQIRQYVPQPYITLGTDGFGRSDTREKLRYFFEVDANNIVYASLHSLYQQGALTEKDLLAAQQRLGINPDKPNPKDV